MKKQFAAVTFQQARIPEMDLDELLRKFDISTVKNKPANGVFSWFYV